MVIHSTLDPAYLAVTAGKFDPVLLDETKTAFI